MINNYRTSELVDPIRSIINPLLIRFFWLNPRSIIFCHV